MKQILSLKILLAVAAILFGHAGTSAAEGGATTVVSESFTSGSLTDPANGAYTWGTQLTGNLTTSGLLLTNNNNVDNNYEGRELLTFRNVVGGIGKPMYVNVDIVKSGNRADKGQDYTFFGFSYYDEAGKLLFSIAEGSGLWANDCFVIYPTAEGNDTVKTGKTHIDGHLEYTIAFTETATNLTVDGKSITLAKAAGVKSVKLFVTGGMDYARGVYMKNLSIAVAKGETTMVVSGKSIAMTNNNDASQNYEDGDFVTFDEPVGAYNEELSFQYDVAHAGNNVSKGQAYTYYGFSHYDADGNLIYSLSEAVGEWNNKSILTYATEDGAAELQLPSHVDKTVKYSVNFAPGQAIINIDGITVSAVNKNVGIKSIKTFVTGGQDFGRGVNISAYQLKVTKIEAPDYATFAIRYFCGETLVKEETNVGVAGEAPELTAAQTSNFFHNGKKYFYLGNNIVSERLLVAIDNSTVVRVECREALTYHYTVANNVNNETYSGEGFEGETVTIPYDQYINNDGTLFEKGTTNGVYGTDFRLEEDNIEIYNMYSATSIKNVVYYSEAEKIDGMIPSHSGYLQARCSGMAGGDCPAGEQVKLCTLTFGKYNITARHRDGGYTFYAGDKEVFHTEYSGNANVGVSETFLIVEPTDIYVKSTKSPQDGRALDWVYIQQFPNPDTENIIPVYDLSLTEGDITGATTYKSFLNNIDALGSLGQGELTMTVTPANSASASVVERNGDLAVEAQEAKIEFNVPYGRAIKKLVIWDGDNLDKPFAPFTNDEKDECLVWEGNSTNIIIRTTGVGMIRIASVFASVSDRNGETTTYEDDPMGITAPQTTESNTHRGVYNLAGQKVTSNFKGIVIVNGKKILL